MSSKYCITIFTHNQMVATMKRSGRVSALLREFDPSNQIKVIWHNFHLTEDHSLMNWIRSISNPLVREYPQIFVGTSWLGGLPELETKIKSGELRRMLNQSGQAVLEVPDFRAAERKRWQDTKITNQVLRNAAVVKAEETAKLRLEADNIKRTGVPAKRTECSIAQMKAEQARRAAKKIEEEQNELAAVFAKFQKQHQKAQAAAFDEGRKREQAKRDEILRKQKEEAERLEKLLLQKEEERLKEEKRKEEEARQKEEEARKLEEEMKRLEELRLEQEALHQTEKQLKKEGETIAEQSERLMPYVKQLQEILGGGNDAVIDDDVYLEVVLLENNLDLEAALSALFAKNKDAEKRWMEKATARKAEIDRLNEAAAELEKKHAKVTAQLNESIASDKHLSESLSMSLGMGRSSSGMRFFSDSPSGSWDMGMSVGLPSEATLQVSKPSFGFDHDFVAIGDPLLAVSTQLQESVRTGGAELGAKLLELEKRLDQSESERLELEVMNAELKKELERVKLEARNEKQQMELRVTELMNQYKTAIDQLSAVTGLLTNLSSIDVAKITSSS